MSKPTQEVKGNETCQRQQAKGQTTKDKPSALQIAQSEAVRCFYCKSLLLITDDKAGNCVCSENCPSRIITVDDFAMRMIRRAWKYKKELEESKLQEEQHEKTASTTP